MPLDIINEMWLPVHNHEGLYQVSDQGRVRGVRTGRILTPTVGDARGHVTVTLMPEKKNVYVHHIVMRAFRGETPEGMVILHKNGVQDDNRLENLAFGPMQAARRQAYDGDRTPKKLSVDDVKHIRASVKLGISRKELARMYNVSQKHISDIIRGDAFGWVK